MINSRGPIIEVILGKDMGLVRHVYAFENFENFYP